MNEFSGGRSELPGPATPIILGPTAVGKTDLVVRLAQRIGGEIVSADSRQTFRKMDIGTAKPTAGEMAAVPHHLIDVAEPGERFTAADFKRLALAAIDDIHSRGKTAIVAGGTGLYINALIGDFDFSGVDRNVEARERCEAAARENPNALHERLAELDPAAAEKIHPSHISRIIRAIEVIEAKRPGQSEGQKNLWPESNAGCAPFEFKLYGLYRDKQKLNERINKRVEDMYNLGLLTEVSALLESGLGEKAQALCAIGYREAALHLSGELSREEAIRETQAATRRFAKRQRTWFRKLAGIMWLNLEAKGPDEWADWLASRLEEDRGRSS